MQADYDVLVVGAGPAGSAAAERMATAGYRVGLVEEHDEVGVPVNCSGIIGVEAFDRFDIPRELVRHSLSRVSFHSPSGLTWGFSNDEVLAHTVVRSELDQFLARRACSAGAELLLSHRVVAIVVDDTGVELTIDVSNSGEGVERARLRARAVVLATGAGIPLLRKMGFHRIPQWVLGVQSEVAMSVDEVEIYLGRKWAPEGFAWVIPLGERRAKVGLLCQSDGPQTLRRFMARADIARRLDGDVGPIACSILPLGFLPKSYSDRVVVVGEAAGHIKATTCGGIYYGMLTAGIASDVLVDSLRRDQLGERSLSRYERRWRELLEEEIRLGLRLRQGARRAGDWGIDRLMSLARREGIARLIQDKANFDWHRDLIHAVLKHATVGRILGVA